MGEGAICVHFKIPVRKEQLCEEPSNDTQFYVKDRYNISQLKEDKILEELENISSTVCGPGSKCLEILRNEQFDFLFSIIYYLEDISYKIRTQVIQLLQIGLKNLKTYIEKRKMVEYSENNLLTKNVINDSENPLRYEFKVILAI